MARQNGRSDSRKWSIWRTTLCGRILECAAFRGQRNYIEFHQKLQNEDRITSPEMKISPEYCLCRDRESDTARNKRNEARSLTFTVTEAVWCVCWILAIPIADSRSNNLCARFDWWVGFSFGYMYKSQWVFLLATSLLIADSRDDFHSGGYYGCIRNGRRATGDGSPRLKGVRRCDLGLAHRAAYVGEPAGAVISQRLVRPESK